MAIGVAAAEEMKAVEEMAKAGGYGVLYQLRVIDPAGGGLVIIESGQDDLTDYHDAWAEVLE